jgi:PiT family inorganic phosphate transporter
MPEATWLIFAVVITALVFDFTNGWNDSANAIATVVSTRVLTPTQAVLLAAVLNVAGAFAFTAVAKTVAKGIVDPDAVTQLLVLAALIAGIGWNAWMTLVGLPVSASHALIGGLVGAGLAQGGLAIVQLSGIRVVLLAMLISPLAGFIVSWLMMKLVYYVTGNWPPHQVNKYFRSLQLLSVSYMSFTHGSNDGQKVMGIITLALYAGGYLPTIEIPIWVKFAAAIAIGLGTMAGGWNVIKTLGMKMLHLKPVHGFAAETGASLVLTASAHFGVPVSTTHTITGSILGVGAATRIKAVRWGVAGKIIYAWVFTLPGTIVISYLAYSILSRIA